MSDSLPQECVLADGATGIMLRRLPGKLSTNKFLEILNQIAEGCYDFVYVPHDKNKESNVALAFVNFVDHLSAKKAFCTLRDWSHPELGSSLRVSQAEIQGLKNNLAFYVARFGLHEVENPHAPRVFEDGQPQPLLEAVKKHLDIELIAEASEHIKSRKLAMASADGSASKSKPRSTQNRRTGSSSFQPFQPTSSRTGVRQTVNTGAAYPLTTHSQMGPADAWQTRQPQLPAVPLQPQWQNPQFQGALQGPQQTDPGFHPAASSSAPPQLKAPFYDDETPDGSLLFFL
ncbi:ML5 [Symbiodinium sp. CCMP2592]|nr:ML5 [Symbiodinium sp. CCMP2592]